MTDSVPTQHTSSSQSCSLLLTTTTPWQHQCITRTRGSSPPIWQDHSQRDHWAETNAALGKEGGGQQREAARWSDLSGNSEKGIESVQKQEARCSRKKSLYSNLVQVFSFYFLKTGSLLAVLELAMYTGWPQSLRDSPASASGVLELKVYVSTPNLYMPYSSCVIPKSPWMNVSV